MIHSDEDHNISQIRFHICTKICYKGRVCKRKTLLQQPNIVKYLDKHCRISRIKSGLTDDEIIYPSSVSK